MERRRATFWVWLAVRIPPGHIRCSGCHGPLKGLIVGWEGACSLSEAAWTAGWRRGRGCWGMSNITLCRGPRPNTLWVMTHLLPLLSAPCTLPPEGRAVGFSVSSSNMGPLVIADTERLLKNIFEPWGLVAWLSQNRKDKCFQLLYCNSLNFHVHIMWQTPPTSSLNME